MSIVKGKMCSDYRLSLTNKDRWPFNRVVAKYPETKALKNDNTV